MESATGVNRRPGSVLDFPRMVAAAKKFVKMDLSPTDQVCVLSGSRNLQFPFTDDKTTAARRIGCCSKKTEHNLSPPGSRKICYFGWRSLGDCQWLESGPSIYRSSKSGMEKNARNSAER